MGGFAELLHQPIQNRLGQIRVLRHAHGQVKETSQPRPCHVALGSGAGAQQIEIHKPPEQAMHRPRLQAELLGDLREGQTGPRGGDGLQDPDVPAQRTVISAGRLDRCARRRIRRPPPATAAVRTGVRCGLRGRLQPGHRAGHDAGRCRSVASRRFNAMTTRSGVIGISNTRTPIAPVMTPGGAGPLHRDASTP